MTRQLISTLTFLTIYFTAFGQHDFGVKVNGGLSYMLTRFEPTLPQIEINKFYPVPSGQGGLFYNFHFNDKFLIGTDILFIPIYGHEYLKIPLVDINGNSVGVAEDHIYRHIYYFGLPVYFGYSLKKLNINLGFQTNLVLTSGSRTKGHSTRNGQEYTWDHKADKLRIINYDYGLRAGLLYNLSEKFTIETNYFYGLTNLMNDISFTWRVQQFTVGLRYKLFPRGRPTSTSTETK